MYSEVFPALIYDDDTNSRPLNWLAWNQMIDHGKLAGTLTNFLLQTRSGDLKTSAFPKAYADLDVKIGFGKGIPARVPWIAFLAPGMQVRNGIYPVYLYYRHIHVLVLAYGISETKEPAESWPAEIINSTETINGCLGEVPRYGNPS